jgi:hypothetical protein
VARALRLILTTDAVSVARITEDEVNEMFTMLDVASLGSEDTVIGPFGMFHVKSTSQALPQNQHFVEKYAVDKPISKQYKSCKILVFYHVRDPYIP